MLPSANTVFMDASRWEELSNRDDPRMAREEGGGGRRCSCWFGALPSKQLVLFLYKAYAVGTLTYQGGDDGTPRPAESVCFRRTPARLFLTGAARRLSMRWERGPLYRDGVYNPRQEQPQSTSFICSMRTCYFPSSEPSIRLYMIFFFHC